MDKHTYKPASSELEHSSEKGIFTESGRCLIEAPSPEILSRFRGNSRVEYFPAQVTEAERPFYPIAEDDLAEMIKSNQLNSLYSLFVTRQLEESLAQSLEIPRVGIRGTVCSIDGEVNHSNIHVKDLEQVLIDGTEKEGDRTLIALLTKKDPRMHHRTKQWVEEGAQQLRAKLVDSPNLQNKLFPVLLVYDLDKLTSLKHYEVQLPPSSEDRAKTILKAYILDYPKTGKEINTQ